MNEEKELKEFKITIIGDCSVGKTSIVRRYTKNSFSLDSVSTLGFDYEYKIIKVKDGSEIRLKLVDTAGQEKYNSLAKNFFKGADGVLTVFSVDNEDSFNNLDKWIKVYNDNRDSSKDLSPIYIVGNKIDLEKQISEDKINEYVKKNNLKLFYCCCSSDDPKKCKIDIIFQTMAQDIYENDKKKVKVPQKNVQISKLKETKPKKKNNCCVVQQIK